jgi:hypothetical protein
VKAWVSYRVGFRKVRVSNAEQVDTDATWHYAPTLAIDAANEILDDILRVRDDVARHYIWEICVDEVVGDEVPREVYRAICWPASAHNRLDVTCDARFMRDSKQIRSVRTPEGGW